MAQSDDDLFASQEIPITDGDAKSNPDIGSDEGTPLTDHPDYNPEELQAALPKVARMDFSQKVDGMIVIKLVARDQTVTEVDLGNKLPPTTADLIEMITAYQATKIDTTLADQAADALDFDV